MSDDKYKNFLLTQNSEATTDSESLFMIFSIVPSSGKLLVEMRKSCKALWRGDYSGENANSNVKS